MMTHTATLLFAAPGRKRLVPSHDRAGEYREEVRRRNRKRKPSLLWQPRGAAHG